MAKKKNENEYNLQHSVVVFKKINEEYKVIEKCDMNHIPQVGSYYITVGGTKALYIEALIYDDMTIYIVVNETDNKYNYIAENRYNDN